MASAGALQSAQPLPVSAVPAGALNGQLPAPALPAPPLPAPALHVAFADAGPAAPAVLALPLALQRVFWNAGVGILECSEDVVSDLGGVAQWLPRLPQGGEDDKADDGRLTMSKGTPEAVGEQLLQL